MASTGAAVWEEYSELVSCNREIEGHREVYVLRNENIYGCTNHKADRIYLMEGLINSRFS